MWAWDFPGRRLSLNSGPWDEVNRGCGHRQVLEWGIYVLQTPSQAFRARNMAQWVQHSLHKSKDPSADLQNPCKSQMLSVCLWHWSSYGRWEKKTGDSIGVMRQVVWTTGLRYGKQGLAPEVVLWLTHVSHGMCMPPKHTLRTFFSKKKMNFEFRSY